MSSHVPVTVHPLVCPTAGSEKTGTQITVDLSSGDLVLEGVKAASQLACPACLPETTVFQAIMEEIATLQVTSVCHVPRRVRPLLSEVVF